MNALLDQLLPADPLGSAVDRIAGELPPGGGAQGSVGAKHITRVRYTHDAMIDLMISRPSISQNELALAFGYTASWISTIIASDAFQARLAERRDKIVDPALRADIKAQLDGIALRSMEILRHKLSAPPEAISDQTALRALEVSARAAGYGARPQVAVQVNVGERLEALGDNITRLLQSKRANEAQRPGGEPPSDPLGSPVRGELPLGSPVERPLAAEVVNGS